MKTTYGISHQAPSSINPLLIYGEAGEEEGAHVEVDKGQAHDRIIAKGAEIRHQLSRRKQKGKT